MDKDKVLTIVDAEFKDFLEIMRSSKKTNKALTQIIKDNNSWVGTVSWSTNLNLLDKILKNEELNKHEQVKMLLLMKLQWLDPALSIFHCELDKYRKKPCELKNLEWMKKCKNDTVVKAALRNFLKIDCLIDSKEYSKLINVNNMYAIFNIIRESYFVLKNY